MFLDLEQWQLPRVGRVGRTEEQETVTVRRLEKSDWGSLPRAFSAAFSQWAPLSQWDGVAPIRAARCILEWARRGNDGPIVAPACMVATVEEVEADKREERIAGAAIVTLVPCDRLRGAPVTEVDHLPHLDWLFVDCMEQRRGIATLLLAAVVRELRALRHRTLASTVISGNPAAILWHWSSGFSLPRGR